MKAQRMLMAATMVVFMSVTTQAQNKKQTVKSENLKTQELQPVEEKQEVKRVPVQSQPVAQPAQVQQETKVEPVAKQPAQQQQLKAAPVTKKETKMAPKAKSTGSAKKAKK